MWFCDFFFTEEEKHGNMLRVAPVSPFAMFETGHCFTLNSMETRFAQFFKQKINSLKSESCISHDT